MILQSLMIRRLRIIQSNCNFGNRREKMERTTVQDLEDDFALEVLFSYDRCILGV